MKRQYPQAIIQYLAVFLITIYCIPANADVWKSRETVYLILLGGSAPAIARPVYEDPANIPELSGRYQYCKTHGFFHIRISTIPFRTIL